MVYFVYNKITGELITTTPYTEYLNYFSPALVNVVIYM
jgi:hypothetical protein